QSGVAGQEGDVFAVYVRGINRPKLAGDIGVCIAYQETRQAAAANVGEMPGFEEGIEDCTIQGGSRFGT
ncbi:hypothetical protein, partial [Pseudomonas aeruginosa]